MSISMVSLCGAGGYVGAKQVCWKLKLSSFVWCLQFSIWIVRQI